MIIFSGKALQDLKDLETCISLVSDILNEAIDKDDDKLFKKNFPLYLRLKRDFKVFTRINYIDIGLEFYAEHLGIWNIEK